MEFAKEIGAYAGLAAFLGLAVLALLYFAQARDVRRLRENASFLVESPDQPESAQPPAPAAAAASTAPKDKAAAAKPGAQAKQPTDAEAFRRAELARQAAERRERFERRRGSGRSLARGGEGRFSRLPETRALAVIIVGAALLVAGVAFGATRIIGGDEDSSGGGGKGGGAKVDVAVLNGTSTPGLAAQFAQKLQKAGYGIALTENTALPFDTSTVMFERPGEQAAREIGPLLDIRQIEPMADQIRPDAAGAPVAVVLGEDKASGG